MYCCCCGKSFTQDGPYDQLKGSLSWQTWAAIGRFELEETGTEQIHQASLGVHGHGDRSFRWKR